MEQSLLTNQLFIFLLLLWILPWKGVALWKAARNSHKWWFIAIFLVNTFALLEILYIFIFSKKRTPKEKVLKNGSKT
jgi:hypothetical protein